MNATMTTEGIMMDPTDDPTVHIGMTKLEAQSILRALTMLVPGMEILSDAVPLAALYKHLQRVLSQ